MLCRAVSKLAKTLAQAESHLVAIEHSAVQYRQAWYWGRHLLSSLAPLSPYQTSHPTSPCFGARALPATRLLSSSILASLDNDTLGQAQHKIDEQQLNQKIDQLDKDIREFDQDLRQLNQKIDQLNQDIRESTDPMLRV